MLAETSAPFGQLVMFRSTSASKVFYLNSIMFERQMPWQPWTAAPQASAAASDGQYGLASTTWKHVSWLLLDLKICEDVLLFGCCWMRHEQCTSELVVYIRKQRHFVVGCVGSKTIQEWFCFFFKCTISLSLTSCLDDLFKAYCSRS